MKFFFQQGKDAVDDLTICKIEKADALEHACDNPGIES